MMLEFPGPIGERPLHLVELPPPLPGPGQVLLEVKYCGVCRWDLHLVEGEVALERLPIIPGHQMVGVVADVGPGVKRLKVGDRVGLGWLANSCGYCEYCDAGQEQLCEAAEFTGLHQDGGLAEVVAAHEDFVHLLPEGVGWETAAVLVGAGALAYRALRRCGLKSFERVGLYGFGTAAQVALLVAKEWDCWVAVFSRRSGHRRWAKEVGADWVGQVQDNLPTRLDRAVIFAPSGRLLPMALAAVRRGGAVVLAASSVKQVPAMDYERHLAYEKTLQVVSGCGRQELREFLKLAARMQLTPRVEVRPLEEANEVLAQLKAGTLRGAGVLAIK